MTAKTVATPVTDVTPKTAARSAASKRVGAKPADGGAAQPVEEMGGLDPTIRTKIKMKEFLDRVVARSGMKRGEARTAIDAALAVLGESVANGEELDLPPLGKIKIGRAKSTPRGKSFTLRLIQNEETATVTPPLADRGEER